MNYRLVILLACVLATARGQSLEFNRDVRPILSDNCFKCHGPDKVKRKGDLRLDVEAAAKAALEGRFAIVPGQPDKSGIIARMESTDPDEHMPPHDSGLQITPREVAVLRQWIEQGAPWQAHWSFIAPKRTAPPVVKDAAWCRTPVDRFILGRLEQEGWKPSPEADAAALLRRVSLDLTGLPPTPAESDAYFADRSEVRYERLVDRLLASPRFGERIASRWLDAARYADTNGYQSDGERSMWRWREWVLDACNTNMPFDQFTIEQLAGDLLPKATLAQRIATGFNRNHRGNAEGGIVPEEFACEYVVDRVDTTATVWLGLTMGCARCHDHKYDPITQREFYSMFAFFNNVPENGRAIKIGNSAPVLTAPTDAQAKEQAALERRLAAAEARLHEREPQIAAALSAWEKAAPNSPWTITRGLQARFELNGNAGAAHFEAGESAFKDGGAEFDGKRYINCGDQGAFGFFDKFTLAAWVNPRGPDGAILSRMSEADDDSAFASDQDGYRVFLKDGRVQVHLTKRWLDDALRVETAAALNKNEWQHVAVVYDGSRVAAGVKIYVNGRRQEQRVLLDQLNQTFLTQSPLRIGAGGGLENRFQGLVRDVRVYARAIDDEEAGIIANAQSMTELAWIPRDQRTPSQAAALRVCFLTDHAGPALRKAYAETLAAREELAAFVEKLPTVMVMEEMPQPRATFVLTRGEYDKPAERVSASVPASLPGLDAGTTPNRLALARWLVAPTHPLTARVAVNHQWQMLFGIGLVKTTEDFGAQGEAPSHPELLDWLATEFVRTGWDVKRMMKLLVMSSTYRQAARRNEAAGADPENRLLSRAPRLRLPAEMIRDQALSAAGLLVSELGGASVKPYQPKGLQKDLSGTDYEQDHGDKLFRRSLYTFWKRTSPQPTMMTFDAAGRETCSVRPSRTDTPLQALALMNDVTFVEAARGIAQRMMREGGGTVESRLSYAFRLVLTRPPKPDELMVLTAGYAEHLAHYRADRKAAEALVHAGESPVDATLDVAELAACSALAGLILNLDEAITKQ
ncbi:DUF1553 domain-containing protein [Prosthecobacter sp.]|uniref:DUF1553 domain-containing protein n=1 Tax=Prosthecobacter sp. TaxID=1965333 RepID=UPI0037833306